VWNLSKSKFMKKSILIGCWFLILFSCKNSDKSVQIPEEFSVKHIVGIMKKPTSVSKEKLAEIAGTSADKIQIYNENFSPDISKRMILFSWPNAEQKTIKTRSGKELKVEGSNSLGMGLVKRISKDDFQNQFESKEFIQNDIERISKDETVNSDIAISEAKFLAENSKVQQFEKVENIGELAYWETPVNALHIYTNGISFTVTTNFPDEKESKSKAGEFLNLILNV